MYPPLQHRPGAVDFATPSGEGMHRAIVLVRHGSFLLPDTHCAHDYMDDFGTKWNGNT